MTGSCLVEASSSSAGVNIYAILSKKQGDPWNLLHMCRWTLGLIDCFVFFWLLSSSLVAGRARWPMREEQDDPCSAAVMLRLPLVGLGCASGVRRFAGTWQGFCPGAFFSVPNCITWALVVGKHSQNTRLLACAWWDVHPLVTDFHTSSGWNFSFPGWNRARRAWLRGTSN